MVTGVGLGPMESQRETHGDNTSIRGHFNHTRHTLLLSAIILDLLAVHSPLPFSTPPHPAHFPAPLLLPPSTPPPAAMGDADSNYPIPSSYPSWWMYFVRPLESQKDYHEKFPEEKKDSTSSDPTPPPQHSPVQPLRLSSPSHLITIMQPAPFTHHLAPQPRLILPSSPLPAPPTSPPSKSSDKKEQPKRFRTRQEQDGVDQADMAKLFRRLFAEFIGTFTLVFFVAGVALEFNLTGAGIDRTAAGLNQAGAGLASGLTLVFCVYTMGELSGAHFNPVVTWAFALRGLFPPVWVVAYWLAQFAGSILAGGFLQAFYFNNAQLGTTAVNTHYQWVTGFAYEALLTFFFINVILAMATRGGNVGRPQHSTHTTHTFHHDPFHSLTRVGCARVYEQLRPRWRTASRCRCVSCSACPTPARR